MTKRRSDPWERFGSEGKLEDDGYAEYPCVNRLRLRRLLTFLCFEGFTATSDAMQAETDITLSTLRLGDLVEKGQCLDASSYISRFLPPPDTKRPTSVEAVALHLFLRENKVLASLVAAGRGCRETPMYLDHSRKACLDGAIRLRSITLNVASSQKVRDSIDWSIVNYRASKVVRELVNQVPELANILLPLTGGPRKPHNILPIAQLGVRRRRQEKQAARPKARALVKKYLRILEILPEPSQERYDEKKTMSKALHWVADLVDDCLKASRARIQPHQTSEETRSATVPPVSQAMFSGLSGLVVHTGMPSIINAGATAAPFSQTMFGSFTCHVINPWVPPPPACAGTSASQEPTTISPFLGTIHTKVSQDVHGDAGAPAVPAPIPSGMINAPEEMKQVWQLN